MCNLRSHGYSVASTLPVWVTSKIFNKWDRSGKPCWSRLSPFGITGRSGGLGQCTGSKGVHGDLEKLPFIYQPTWEHFNICTTVPPYWWEQTNVSPASRNHMEGGGKEKGMGSFLEQGFVFFFHLGENILPRDKNHISLDKNKSHDHHH